MSSPLSSIAAFWLSLSDPDYRRMRRALGREHNADLYWHFVNFRRHFEQKWDYDRNDPQIWADFFTFEPLPKEEDKPDPALQEAEALFGLKSGSYDRETFDEIANAFAAEAAERQRRGDKDKPYDRARVAKRTIQRAKGWT